MAIQFVQKRSGTGQVRNLPTAAGLQYDTADGKVKFNGSGTVKSVVVEGAPALSEVLTATRVLVAADSGKTFYLNSATEFATTLPAAALGLRFKFVVVGAPSGASYTIVGASGTPIHGMVLSKDLNGATDGGATAGTGVLTITLVDGKAVKGDTVIIESDGTDWYAIASTGGPFDAITYS